MNRKLLNWCERVLLSLAVLSTFVIMCLATVDSIGRYLLKMPIYWSYDVTEKYLMVSTVFLGACYAYRKGAYIRVTFFIDRLPQKTQVALNYFVQVLSILFCGILVVASTQKVFRVAQMHLTLSSLPYPLWPAHGIVPVGLFFMTLLMLLDLKKVGRGESSLFKKDSDSVTTGQERKLKEGPKE